MEQKIKDLLQRFYEGETTLAEEQYLREFFSRTDAEGGMSYEKDYFLFMSKERNLEPHPDFMKETLQDPERPLKPKRVSTVSWPVRIAASVALLITGYWLGYNNSGRHQPLPASNNDQVAVQPLLSFDYQSSSSASDRILALNKLSDDPDERSVQILINTLHFDPNVNVRMSALNVLRPLASKPVVVDAFIQSLPIQQDPFLQIALIESLSEIGEKRAVRVLIKVSEDKEKLELVRQKAQEAASIIQANEWLKSI